MKKYKKQNTEKEMKSLCYYIEGIFQNRWMFVVGQEDWGFCEILQEFEYFDIKRVKIEPLFCIFLSTKIWFCAFCICFCTKFRSFCDDFWVCNSRFSGV